MEWLAIKNSLMLCDIFPQLLHLKAVFFIFLHFSKQLSLQLLHFDLSILRNIMRWSYALYIIHCITGYFFIIKTISQNLSTVGKRWWVQQEHLNHVKTSVTVDFSFKSSWAFSAASQAFFSTSFSAKATSASFCINKKCYLGHTFLHICIGLTNEHPFSFWDEVSICITFNSWASSVFLESSAVSSSTLTPVMSILPSMDWMNFDFLS